METYCLLQERLDGEIDFAALEAAAAATRAISRLDCLGLHRDMHGVVVAGLDQADALAFQGVLAARGHATRLCADDDFPLLHESFQVQRLDRHADTLLLTSSMGRVIERGLEDLVFLAAGFYQKIDVVRNFDRRIEYDADGNPSVVENGKYGEKRETDFRLDLFFSRDPHRLNLGLTKDSAVFFHGRALRQKDRPGLTAMMEEVAGWLPEERINTQLRDPQRVMAYRGLHLYENEIRWHFQRFMTGK
jgi:hypothetical protein